eukprot:1393789-Pyramimonas_sp.AAC.1
MALATKQVNQAAKEVFTRIGIRPRQSYISASSHLLVLARRGVLRVLREVARPSALPPGATVSRILLHLA